MSTKPPPGARIAIYARDSSDRSPENPFKEQMRHLRTQARKRGWKLGQVFQGPAASSAIQPNPSQDDGGPEGGE